MAFKSRQRAKHSHLFGDDPLNASSPASDDPLFGSSAPSPKSSDPLRSKENGSIFGNIDVSKLGSGSLYNKRSALRNSQEDEDALFGASRRSPRKHQQATTTTTSSSSSARSSLSDNASSKSEVNATTRTSPSSPMKPPPPPVPERPASAAATIRPQQALPEKKPPPPPVPQRPLNNKKAAPPPVPERPSTTATSPSVTPDQIPSPASSSSLNPQQNNNTTSSSLFSRFLNNNKKSKSQSASYPDDNNKQDNEEQQQQHDPYYDDPELLASVANDALRFDTTPPTMNPSISTPQSESNPWSILVDPIRTTSSPLIKSPQQRQHVMDIEPAKRTAFADLIDSWHNDKRPPIQVTPPADDEQFFTRVAAEQRDIGFAGIDGKLEEEQDLDQHHHQQHHHHHLSSSNHLWDIEETDNPWR
ncbi:hypothetical protein LRAMOSA04937 [Lichtheimia ramosa]|uniref:Uncharacterized protein n=1 Tax=Lichtheimia ramosa TaxID=688394 RepID=A0A077X0K3_9FUNG|nr:hypothetical protein LRAMOSA04937 [Lichtheimia ramosa]